MSCGDVENAKNASVTSRECNFKRRVDKKKELMIMIKNERIQLVLFYVFNIYLLLFMESLNANFSVFKHLFL